MKNEEKEILTAYLGDTLNLPAETVTSLFEEKDGEQVLKAEAKTILKDADIARVAAFKADAKTQKDNAYSKAKAEVLTKFEEEFKAKYNFESEKKGLDLFAEFVASKADPDNKLTADKIKIHPEFLKLESDWKKAAKAELDKVNAEFEEYKTGITKEKAFSNVSTKAIAVLDKLKPILSKDAEKANKQKQLLLNELKGFEFQEVEGNVVVMKDGKRYEDAHGKPISFESLVKETAGQYWDFEEGGHHSSTGAGDKAKPGDKGKPAGDPATKWTGAIPKNDNEYSKMFAETKTASERVMLTNAYEESQKSG